MLKKGRKDLNNKKTLTIAANLTTFSAILAGIIGLGLLGLSLSYHPRPKAESLMWLATVISASVLPVIIIWVLKLQFIRWQWLRNILLLSLFTYGGGLAVYMGQWGIRDLDDFIIWFPLFLYGGLIVFTGCLLARLKP